jgi:toxin ParE1/3/4
MSFEIILYPDAILDIQEGIDHYKLVSTELGKKFLFQVNNTFEELKQFPFYELRYDNVRMRKIKVFPYIVHFVVDEEKNIISIYGVRFALQNSESSWFFKEDPEIYESTERTKK